MKYKKLTLVVGLIILWYTTYSQDIFTTKTGTINFVSDAPLEVIKASSNKMAGVIKTSDKSFLFSMDIKTFQGFNSTLQRTHFNENYMESGKYPKATFEGKIIEDINFNENGSYTVRAKGKITIHGVSQQRIIKSKLIIGNKTLKISSDFTVLLKDHKIQIPTVVYQKLAEEIKVNISAELSPQTK